MQHNGERVELIDQPQPIPNLTVRALVLSFARATIPAAAVTSHFGFFAGIVTIASANPSAVVSMAVAPRGATTS
jgi:uncharacterized oligopeptide transporter (OPT) family protein